MGAGHASDEGASFRRLSGRGNYRIWPMVTTTAGRADRVPGSGTYASVARLVCKVVALSLELHRLACGPPVDNLLTLAGLAGDA